VESSQIDNNLEINYQTHNNWIGSETYLLRITSTLVFYWWLWMCSSVFHESNASKTARITLEIGSKQILNHYAEFGQVELSQDRVGLSPLGSARWVHSCLNSRLGSAPVGSGAASEAGRLECLRVGLKMNWVDLLAWSGSGSELQSHGSGGDDLKGSDFLINQKWFRSITSRSHMDDGVGEGWRRRRDEKEADDTVDDDNDVIDARRKTKKRRRRRGRSSLHKKTTTMRLDLDRVYLTSTGPRSNSEEVNGICWCEWWLQWWDR